MVWEGRSLPHLIVSTTTKRSALSSRNPILSPHWPGAIDGWKEGMRQPIRKRDGEGDSKREWRERKREPRRRGRQGEMDVFMNTNLLEELRETRNM